MSNGDTTYSPGDYTTNQHPITGRMSDSLKGFFGAFVKFFKSNPIAAFLSTMFLLALVIPPRKRKRKATKTSRKSRGKRGREAKKRCKSRKRSRKSKKRRESKKNRAKAKKTTKAKKIPIRKTKRIKKVKKSGGRKPLPQWIQDKGYTNWPDWMAHLRSLRKSK